MSFFPNKMANQRQSSTVDEELACSAGINGNSAGAVTASSASLGDVIAAAVPDLSSVRETLAQPPPKSWQEHTSRGYKFSVALGLSLAFSAGYSNGVCLSGFLDAGADSVKQSVAGVTGLYTNSAIFLAEREFYQASFMAGTIFSVMFGAFISALLNPYPVAFEISPRYGLTFLIGSVFMTLGATGALHNNQREFYFTAIANGIQNGVSSMYSANLLRTSHLTGTTTDIGLFLGMALRGNRSNNWKLYILISLAVSFWLGSLSGFFAGQVKRQYSLIFNAAFFFVISMCVILRTCIVYKVSFLDAIWTGKWSEVLDHVDIVHANNNKDKENSDNGVEGAEKTDKRLDEEELQRIFNEIASQSDDGKVDQQAMIAYLASHGLKVQKHRKPLISVLHTAFVTMGDGDWKLSKDDWNGLVHQSTTNYSTTMSDSRSSMMMMHASKKSILKSSRQLASLNASRSGAVSGPEALRRASIIQLGNALDLERK